MIWFFRVICVAFILYSLNFFPLIPSAKVASPIHYLHGVIEEESKEDANIKKLIPLSLNAIEALHENNSRYDNLRLQLSIVGSLFGLFCFIISFVLGKHNKAFKNADT